MSVRLIKDVTGISKSQLYYIFISTTDFRVKNQPIEIKDEQILKI